MNFFTLAMVILTCITSCTSKEIKKTNMVGKYSAHLELDQTQFNKQAVRDSINTALGKVKDDLAKAKIEMDVEMDTSFIDTSTAEGKMEYFAKSFAKSIAAFGKDLGEMGILLGEAAGDVATGAMDFADNVVSKVHLDVELAADGKIITSSDLANRVQFVGSSWEVKDQTFLFKDDKGQVKSEYKILQQDENGFVLGHEKYRLIFTKKQ